MRAIDTDARCERHVGEAFPPRCLDCQEARADLEQQRLDERHERALERNAALGIEPGRVCMPTRRYRRQRR